MWTRVMDSVWSGDLSQQMVQAAVCGEGQAHGGGPMPDAEPRGTHAARLSGAWMGLSREDMG